VTAGANRPFWSQSFPFSCGPAALGGVLGTLGWRPPSDRRRAELAIWRESTAVACPGAHPLGLALAAHRRGFASEVAWRGPSPWLWEHIRSKHRAFSLRDYRQIEASLAEECRAASIPVRRRGAPPARSGPGLLLTTAPQRAVPGGDPHWIGLCPNPTASSS
jgi:Peptidase_C39 like family